MGSSKKPKKRAAKPTELAVGGDSAPAVAEPDANAQASLVQLAATVDQLAQRIGVVEHQLERALLLQQRTNTLLELLAGSAFDVELGAEPPR